MSGKYYQEQFPFDYSYDEAWEFVHERKGVAKASINSVKIRMYRHKYDRTKFDIKIKDIQINGLPADSYRDFLSGFRWFCSEGR